MRSTWGVVVVLVVGCSARQAPIADAPAPAVRVGLADVEGAPRGEKLVVRASRHTVYVFDFEGVDFRRVELVTPDGHRLDLDQEIGELMNQHLVDPLTAPDG